VTPYLVPKEQYAMDIYKDILENGWTTAQQNRLTLTPHQFYEGTCEFRDNPWKYGNKALICSNPYAGVYKFATSQKEILRYMRWKLRYSSTRNGRTIRVSRAFRDGYGSNPEYDHYIRSAEYSNEIATHLTKSGLYIAS